MRAPVLHVAGALLLVCAFSGCASTSTPGAEPPFASTGAPGPEPAFAAENDELTCVSWVPFESVDDAAVDGQIVVRAELESTSVTVVMHGERAALHRATVTEVFAGDAAIGDVLDVVSTPTSCTDGAPYPEGDPMLRDEATLVLNPGSPAPGSADFLQTITPNAGVWDERPSST